MKIVTVIGARPQFIKATVVSAAFRAATEVEEILVHTGQHHDPSMSQVFFDQLQLQPPKYNLGIAGGHHGEQTGKMLAATEQALLKEKPDWVLVYGDTNSTLAGAVAASKLHIPVAHVEAGLRSFNRRMPEEINRVLTDHVSSLLFVPTETAMQNLCTEGIREGVHLVGDVMQDAIAQYVTVANERSTALADNGLQSARYALATVHRAENTDDPNRFNSILAALKEIATNMVVLWPLHPRVRNRFSGKLPETIRLIEPAAYLDMLAIESNARLILTDSGGVQKEARWLNVPCVTMRDETEWVETLEGGWNRLAGANTQSIVQAAAAALQIQVSGVSTVRGCGAAARIADLMALVPAQPSSSVNLSKFQDRSPSQGLHRVSN